jgi:C4-dicarboxylate-specific signal transduction histidine kinase
MTFFISYFYVKNTYDDFDVQMERFVQEYYENQKKFLKKEIDTMVDILKYNSTKEGLTQEEIKEDMIRLLNNISFQENKSNYVFVYDIKNISGGDDFARMVVNPNRPDLYGKLISTHYKDADGKKFREDFLKDIREKGESYTQYAYKKPHSIDIKQKLSYFKHYPAWNWVIAAGVYIDDIEKELEHKRKALKLRVKTQVIQNILLFVLFLSIAIVMSILVSQKIDEVLKNYRDNVKAKSRQLQELNNSLERRVFEEIDKNREKEQLLVQKSRFIALGEMISNIAHQWRQPLSELSSLLMSIKFKHDMGKLDSDAMARKSQEAEKVIDFMSHTIDDFRNFFMPKKDRQEFYVSKSVDSVMTIISSALSNNNIQVNIAIDKNLKLNTFKNEYEQVILNVISNAKDVLISQNSKDPMIKIYAQKSGNLIELFIEDNGGGITVKPRNKIFEPYFTTKEDSDGTGIGLYMSKIIVDKNMHGKLRVRNTGVGARFEILVPITAPY